MNYVAGRLRRTLSGAALCALGMVASLRCGGTSGREGLADNPAADDAGTISSPDDADLDQGLFDVAATYVDRLLPDVVTPPKVDGGAASPWPNCPPFIPTGPDGGPYPLGERARPSARVVRRRRGGRARDGKRTVRDLRMAREHGGRFVPDVFRQRLGDKATSRSFRRVAGARTQAPRAKARAPARRAISSVSISIRARCTPDVAPGTSPRRVCAEPRQQRPASWHPPGRARRRSWRCSPVPL